MKKISILLIIILLVIIVVWRFFFYSNEGKVVCTNSIYDSEVSIHTRYEISYKEKFVQNIKTTEKIRFDDSDLLKEYKEVLEAMYSPYRNLKYYSNSIVVDSKTITSITNINYQKIDVEKFLAIDSKNKGLFKDRKVSLKKLKSIYQKTGAICK